VGPAGIEPTTSTV